MKLHSIVLIICMALLVSYSCPGPFAGKCGKSNAAFRADTLQIRDSVFQIVTYNNGFIQSIRLVDNRMESEEGVSSQQLIFHENGVLKSVEMTNGFRLAEMEDHGEYVYQRNECAFSEKGTLINALFMDDFKTVLSYGKK